MCKRKFDADDEATSPQAKQLKLVPFPTVDADMDIAMSEASSPESMFSEPTGMYSRSNNVSTSSYASSTLDSPTFDFVKPSVPLGCAVLGRTFVHNNVGCTQLPKLRMACAAGPGQTRSMWSHCEQCGAIAMVDLD